MGSSFFSLKLAIWEMLLEDKFEMSLIEYAYNDN